METMMYVGMLASSTARNSSTRSLATDTRNTPAIDSSMRAKNSPASPPNWSERDPVASALVGQASSTSIAPTPAASSLT
jgi:hypothetical protein